MRLLLVLTISVFALTVGGCVVVVGGDDDDNGFHTVHEYERINDRNEDEAQDLIDDLRDMIEQEEDLRNEDIRLSAWKGKVTLTGEASSAAAIDRTISLVASDSRVNTVESKVRVVVRN